ncbi:hypothetical protein [Paenibacillus turpanensis]|uniref:hypothetical protein n=1 Tax=Paenibacillus turpanensis TaxID=2689078 RepID=UPI00140BFBDA|nr:hypothetical protein [Paenibacillus turpanensis]
MNPGILSLILLFSVWILWASGWKEVLLGSVSNYVILLFFAAWIGGFFFTIPIYGDLQAVGVYVPLVTMIVVIWMKGPFLQSLHGISFALFLGAIISLMEKLQQVDPMLQLYRLLFQADVVAVLMTLAYTRQPLQQIAVISLALTFHDATIQLLEPEGSARLLGGPMLQDHLWTQLLTVRLLSAAVETAWQRSRQWAGNRLGIKKGEDDPDV